MEKINLNNKKSSQPKSISVDAKQFMQSFNFIIKALDKTIDGLTICRDVNNVQKQSYVIGDPPSALSVYINKRYEQSEVFLRTLTKDRQVLKLIRDNLIRAKYEMDSCFRDIDIAHKIANLFEDNLIHNEKQK